ncbi:hypothetical protein, partial [Ligilactobacillus salivarius]|uniref:hypothetical protein n=1 Tax=Ligilactobacillus salivarius TaxID=1624 RepID=UPI002097A6D0
TIRLSSNSLKIIIKILASVLFDKEPTNLLSLLFSNGWVSNTKFDKKIRNKITLIIRLIEESLNLFLSGYYILKVF